MEKEVKEMWVTWVEFLRAVKVRNGLEEALAEIFPPRPFSDMGTTTKVKRAFPDLPEDTLAEVGKLAEDGGLEVWRGENGEAELHIPLPVREPNLERLLEFLGRVGEPGEAVVLREVKRLYHPTLNDGLRVRVAGWVIEEMGVRPLELGVFDPATGRVWEINPYTYLPIS
jgi:hypothetical protein